MDFSGTTVLCLGDIMLDRFCYCGIERISPEAPVPVVRATHQSAQPGGAANVAMNLAKLGAGVALVGFTGGDADERGQIDAELECRIHRQGFGVKASSIIRHVMQ